MINCPHCLFPLAARFLPEHEGSILVPCGTCKAILRVTLTTMQPPAASWESNEGRRINHSRAATTTCAKCFEVVEVGKMSQHQCPHGRTAIPASSAVPAPTPVPVTATTFVTEPEDTK